MSRARVEDKLAVDKFDVDREVHIQVDGDICKACEEHYCVYVCPADCYKLGEGHVTYSYEGCLECGSCRIACRRGAIEWTLPRAGFGVCFEYG